MAQAFEVKKTVYQFENKKCNKIIEVFPRIYILFFQFQVIGLRFKIYF